MDEELKKYCASLIQTSDIENVTLGLSIFKAHKLSLNEILDSIPAGIGLRTASSPDILLFLRNGTGFNNLKVVSLKSFYEDL